MYCSKLWGGLTGSSSGTFWPRWCGRACSNGVSGFITGRRVSILPLSFKGRKIRKAMEKEYGEKKGDQVFYASENAGKIRGLRLGRRKK